MQDFIPHNLTSASLPPWPLPRHRSSPLPLVSPWSAASSSVNQMSLRPSSDHGIRHVHVRGPSLATPLPPRLCRHAPIVLVIVRARGSSRSAGQRASPRVKGFAEVRLCGADGLRVENRCGRESSDLVRQVLQCPIRLHPIAHRFVPMSIHISAQRTVPSISDMHAILEEHSAQMQVSQISKDGSPRSTYHTRDAVARKQGEPMPWVPYQLDNFDLARKGDASLSQKMHEDEQMKLHVKGSMNDPRARGKPCGH